MSGSGRVAAALADPIAVEGELAMGRVDLTPYLPPAAAASQPASAKPQAAALTEDWSDAPIALPLPLPVDVDFRLRAEGVKARQLELGAVNTRLQADRQQATVTIDELQAYGGRLTGNARATPGSPPAYAVELQSQGIGLLATLQALTGKGRFDGKADIGLRLTAAGNSQRQLVGGLGGDGKIVLRDGAILGINIAGMLRQIMTLGLNPGATQAAADRLRRGRRQLPDPERHPAQRRSLSARTGAAPGRCRRRRPAAAHRRLSDHAAARHHARGPGRQRQAGPAGGHSVPGPGPVRLARRFAST